MSERNINIDDLFKDALKDFKVESPLRSKTAKKESFAKKNAVGLALGALGLSTVAALFFFFSHELIDFLSSFCSDSNQFS